MPDLLADASPTDLIGPFKQAMRRLAATVTIITTDAGGTRHGMAATAVNSVTTAPPTLLICVNANASIHAPLLASGVFCVNLLGTQHETLVAMFSGKAMGEDRFRHGDWSRGYAELPCLTDAPASVFCKVLSTTPCGSHSIVIGEVRDVRLAGEAQPLIYHDGALLRALTAPGSGR